MENSQHCSTSNGNAKKYTTHQAAVLVEILEEYSLKRNQFDPSRPSPNAFIDKLELRMKVYYNNLYRSKNLTMK